MSTISQQSLKLIIVQIVWDSGLGSKKEKRTPCFVENFFISACTLILYVRRSQRHDRSIFLSSSGFYKEDRIGCFEMMHYLSYLFFSLSLLMFHWYTHPSEIHDALFGQFLDHHQVYVIKT